MNSKPLRASLKVISEARRGPHPDPEQLLTYHLGELDAATTEAVEKHLAMCSVCSRHILDMARFLEGETAANPERGSELTTERLMRSVTEALAADQTEAAAVTGQESPSSPRLRARRESGIHFFYTLGFARAAAVIFAATTAALAGYFVSSREDTTAGVDLPMTNVPVFELTTSETRGPGERDTIQLPGDTPGAMLVFPLVTDYAFARYELTVMASSGDVAFRRSDLRRTADGLLTLVVPRDFLSAGSYRVTIHGLDDGATLRSLSDFELHWRLD